MSEAVSSSSKDFSSSSEEQIPSELSIKHFSSMSLVGTDFTLERVESRNAEYVRHAIGFTSNGLHISGILNIPVGKGPFPLVVLNHGYIDPKIYTRGRGLKREQDYLAREGFAVLHVDYRGHADSDPSPDERKIYDAGLEYSMDVLNAIAALKAAGISEVDTEHIGMMGHSMGGGVTQNILVAYPDIVDAAVLYASVHGDAWENFYRWRREREEDDRTVTLGTPEENPEAWTALSSSSWYERIQSPVLVFHGDKDSDVPVEWSRTIVERLKALEKNVTYIEYPGEKHEFIPRWTDFMEKTSAFFRASFSVESAWISPLQTDRVTLKRFGTFVTPEQSPVQPERFKGFHTGLDFELRSDEEPHSVRISAACDGEVLLRKFVSGYGGVLLQLCLFNNEPVTVLYGHLSLDSVAAKVGDRLTAGQIIGTLGDPTSGETDGERAHLHFAVHNGDALELRGYVQREDELQQWIDPIALF